MKPKGMQLRTCERLQREDNAYVNAALAGMSTRPGLLQERLGAIDSPMDRWRQQ